MTDSFRFFCVRGYMKSGTNWMCRLLNLHADVHCIGEFHWESFYRASSENVERIAPKRRELLQSVLDRQLPQMIRGALIELSGKSSGVIGDRTPTTIAPVVMQVPHIVMVRDFRDVIVSRMFHLYNHPRVTTIFQRSQVMAARLSAYQSDRWYFRDRPEQLLDCEEIVRDSAAQWSHHLRCDRETVAAMPDLPVLFIQYEDLHSQFEATLKEVFKFLTLDVPTAIPDSLTPGHEEENPDQLNRKGQIGDWQNYINDTIMGWIVESAGSEIDRFLPKS